MSETAWAPRVRAIGLCLLCVLLGPAAIAGDDDSWVIDRTFETGEGTTLWLDADRGGITIRGESRDTIRFRVGARDLDAEEARDALDVTFEEVPGGLEVNARFEGRDGGWLSGLFGRSGGVYYEVLVPHRTRLVIDNGSGGFRAEEIEGDVNIDNGSGGIRLADIVGDVTIDNGSGGIRIDDLEGALEVDNGSGGVRASDVVGDVSIDNGSGGIRLEGVDGALEVETSSGGVNARMVGSNAGIRAETGSGGVRITVPSDWGADLDLRTGHGDIVLRDWGVNLDDAERYQGPIGGGGPLISMRSSSGDLVLEAD